MDKLHCCSGGRELNGMFSVRLVAAVISAICYHASAVAAALQTAFPQFAPNGSVGWVAFAPVWIAPPNGPGPVRDDPRIRVSETMNSVRLELNPLFRCRI
jgi:hypothetical protein